jgi:hypothetical protein
MWETEARARFYIMQQDPQENKPFTLTFNIPHDERPNMRKNHLFALWLLLAVLLPLSAGAEEKPIKLKLATVIPAKHAYNLAGMEFARRIKDATGGSIEIRVFPGGQLGKGEN